jgi:flagellar biosynthesis regulator FlaF
MGENAKARDPEEQAVMTGQLWEFGHGDGREGWPDRLTEPCEPAHEVLGLLQGKVPGHRWDGWRRLTGDEGYFAACSCGWRSSETGCVNPVLCQVKEHLDAVGAVRGWRTSAQTAQKPGRDERAHRAGPRGVRPDERTRELYASVDNQQRRLSQALERSADLLSASQEQAERFVAALEHAAAKIAPAWARTTDAVQKEEVLQRRAERAKELRDGIVSAAGALAAIVEEVALASQDQGAGRLGGSAGDRRLGGEATDWQGAGESGADDLHLACGLGRAAD